MPATSDAFASGASPCGAWGVATAMEDSVRDAGLHVIVPPGHDGYTATCTDGSLPFDAGTFVSISAVTTLASGFSQLAVSTTGGSLARLDYFVDLGTLELADAGVRGKFGRMAYDPVAMRWWRLYPISAHEIAGQYSPDGLAWTTLGIEDVGSDSLMAVEVVIGAGYYAAETTSSATVFDSWNVCP